MTFYQELQLNQAGSKALIRNIKDPKEKWKHICIYLFKILLTVAFCVVFVTIYTKVFGEENSIVGVVVLPQCRPRHQELSRSSTTCYHLRNPCIWTKNLEHGRTIPGIFDQCSLHRRPDVSWLSQCNYVQSFYIRPRLPAPSGI